MELANQGTSSLSVATKHRQLSQLQPEPSSGPAATGSSLPAHILEPPPILRRVGNPQRKNREKRERAVYRRYIENSEVSRPWTALKPAWIGFHPCGHTARPSTPAQKEFTSLCSPLQHQLLLTLCFFTTVTFASSLNHSFPK